MKIHNNVSLVKACVFYPPQMTQSRWELSILSHLRFLCTVFSEMIQTLNEAQGNTPWWNNLAGFGRGRLLLPHPRWCWRCAEGKPGLKEKCWEPLEPPSSQWLQCYYPDGSKLHMNREAKTSSVPFSVTNMHMHKHAGDHEDKTWIKLAFPAPWSGWKVKKKNLGSNRSETWTLFQAHNVF